MMNKSLQKVFHIFEKLADSNGPKGVNELARELNLPNSTVSRLIQSMESYGLLRQDPTTKKFHLGLRLFELGCKALEDIGLQGIAVPEMERLRDEVNENVLLMILEDTHITYIHKIECEQAVVIRHAVGSTAPAYCVSGGKAMLAYMPERIEKTIKGGLKSWTSNTITDPEELRQECEKVRKLGYATVKEEFREGVSGIAAPIFDMTNLPVAAVSVPVPTSRLNRKRLAELVAAIKSTSNRISQMLAPNRLSD